VQAQAHDFIMSFPDEYATVVGERGMMLSGGQRQRIALARAFLTNPAILILDDSTSAIDSATEDQIQQAIERASAGRTTILITHRLSQIRWADKIVVLRKGRVAAQGTHADLIATSQPYRDIFAQLLGWNQTVVRQASFSTEIGPLWGRCARSICWRSSALAASRFSLVLKKAASVNSSDAAVEHLQQGC
jgi:ABC-type multidrug transport system ATPase subunit